MRWASIFTSLNTISCLLYRAMPFPHILWIDVTSIVFIANKNISTVSEYWARKSNYCKNILDKVLSLACLSAFFPRGSKSQLDRFFFLRERERQRERASERNCVGYPLSLKTEVFNQQHSRSKVYFCMASAFTKRLSSWREFWISSEMSVTSFTSLRT